MPKEAKIDEDSVALTGILSEFRTALRHEIDAATANASSSSIELINGRKIAQIGGAYQYIFDVENALNLPGDTPGDLYVPGRSPTEVVVVSIEGMSIKLSIPEDLGKFVPSAKLQSNLAFLMRKLIERIEAKADFPNPVGNRILGESFDEKACVSEISNGELNDQQHDAVVSSIDRNTTFIWGPPGTGKTHTIGSIGNELYQQGRDVLLVSHTNTAVDGALRRIGISVNPEQLLEGKVVRVGQPQDTTLNPELLLRTHVERRSEELTNKKTDLEAELSEHTVKLKDVTRNLDICEWTIEAETDISSMEKEISVYHSMDINLEEMKSELQEEESLVDYWDNASRAAHTAKKYSTEILNSESLINDIENSKTIVEEKLNETSSQLSGAKKLLEELESLGWVTRKWRRLPSPEEQSELIEHLNEEFGKLGLELDDLTEQNRKAHTDYICFKNRLTEFQKTYDSEPDDVIRLADEHTNKISVLRKDVKDYADAYGKKSTDLQDIFSSWLLVLKELELARRVPGSIEGMFDAIKDAYRKASLIVEDQDIEQLRTGKKQLNNRIKSIQSELAIIEESLKRVEEIVIKEASIVATTLTRAYLKDSIQGRRFDTVILDEASMAPIPALWIAASVADNNVVVVGDPKQLPPIVLSSHEMSQRWLGRDIFEVADVIEAEPSCLIELRRQYRMHPDISSIPNNLIYNDTLIDDNCTKNMDGFTNWYNVDWEHDNSVLLVDTASVGAWVTSVARGKGSSRLNFLSATICVDLIEQILNENRQKLKDGDRPRVLMACPYRPHAKLLELLIREQGLGGEVAAGTAHSFQGSEADVVIFDLVNDEPHWKVAMFMPTMDKDTKRLLNVALTRAKKRLIVVGDFEYIGKLAKKSFLGAKLLPFLLEKFPKVDALDVVKNGLAARAVNAQKVVYGGEVEPPNKRIVVTQKQFYRYLCYDLNHANFRVVIYSPFITQNRITQLEPHIRAATERGIRLYIITKAHSDRSKKELQQYRRLENTLTEWGVVMVHKQRMHEKLVFIDDNIIWEGSLNPLSFKDTQEHMERRESKAVFSEYAKTLHLYDLINEYDDGEPRCPICESEIVACEGKDEPFYWRCVVKDCYTRSIDQPALQGGVINCNSCGSKVEFGQWGGKPAWRCVENRRHHQRMARTHLRLPKMRDIISSRDLKKLDKQFKIVSPDYTNKKPLKYEQHYLFD